MHHATTQDIPDETLLIAYAHGDAQAARDLVLRLGPFCLRVAYRQLGRQDDAEDIAQEAMLRLWRQAPNWRQGDAKVTTWLYRVIFNLCVDHRRRRTGTGLEEIEEPRDESQAVQARLQEQQRANALRLALDELPERQRMAMSLRHLEDLTNPAIAGIMEISVEAVESLLGRGKRLLIAKLAPQKAALGLIEEDHYA